MPHVARLAPPGWTKQQQQADQDVQPYDAYDAEATYSVSDQESSLDVGEADRPGVRGRPAGLSSVFLFDAVEFAKRTPWQMAHRRHLHGFGRDHRAGGGTQDSASPGEDRTAPRRGSTPLRLN